MNDNQSVYSSLKNLIGILNNFVAIVRSIDSSEKIEDIRNILNFHNIYYDYINENICLSKTNLNLALDADVFTGFDEVWVFLDHIPEKSLSSIPVSTSDSIHFDEEIDKNVLTCFKDYDCAVLLADGCGLNYMTKNVELEKLLF